MDAALRLEPGSSVALLVRANAAYELGDSTRVASTLADAARGKDPEARVARVLEASTDRVKSSSSEPLAELVREGQSTQWVWRFYVPLLFGEGKLADAIPVLRAALEKEESPVAREKLAGCLMSSREGQVAFPETLKDWLAAWPEAHCPRFYRGYGALRQDTQTALEDGRWLVAHGDGRGHALRADAFLALGKADEVLAECDAWSKLPEQPGDGSLKIIPITRAQAYAYAFDVENA